MIIIHRPTRYILLALFVTALIIVRSVPVSHEHVPAFHPVVHEHKSLFLSQSLKYDVTAAGIKSLRASLKIDFEGTAYDIALEAEAQGFIGKLFPWKTSTRTTGHIDEKDSLIPTLHTERSTWRQNVTVTEISYDSLGKAVKMTVQDNNKTATKQDMNSALANKAVDVLTGMLTLLQNTNSTHKCAGKFPVFDGRRRFDVTLADDGTEVLAPSGNSRFAGEALRCIFKTEPIAGFEPKDLKRGWMAIQNYTEARHRPPTIWLAKQNGQMIPVRMEITSAYGSAVASLSDGPLTEAAPPAGLIKPVSASSAGQAP